MKKKKILSVVVILLCATITGKTQNTSPYWSLAGNSNAAATSKLGTTTAVPLKLFTNNAVRLYIGSSGNVGIGTTAPTYKLHVVGAANGIYGSGTTYGVYGSGGTYGVYGSGTSYGVYGYSASSYGVFGSSGYAGLYGSGTSYGVIGSGATGVYGSGSSYALYGSGGTYGAYATGSSYGVYGNTSTGYGVYGNASSSGYGVTGISSSGYGVYGSSSSSWGSVNYGVYGVYGSGTTGYGVEGVSSSSYGVYGYSSSSYGVYGSSGYLGVYGTGTTYGLYGYSADGYGGYLYSSTWHGLWAHTSSSASNIYAGVFDSRVYSYGGYFQSSDRNLKKNIKDIGNAMSIINQLKPKNYEFRDDGKFADLNLPKGTHYGLIAQELEQVLPNLVSEGPKQLNGSNEPIKPRTNDLKEPATAGEQQIVKPAIEKNESMTFKGVNYDELIPLLIKGMQEQDATITKQQAQIDELKKLMTSVSTNTASDAIQLTGAWLKQNSPNPFRESTAIQFALPASVKDAQLLVYDQNGRLVKSVSIASGQNQVNISRGSLPSGNYVYTLMVDGKKVDTKSMILAK